MAWSQSTDPSALRKVRKGFQQAVALARHLHRRAKPSQVPRATTRQIERARAAASDGAPVDARDPSDEWPPTAPLIWLP